MSSSPTADPEKLLAIILGEMTSHVASDATGASPLFHQAASLALRPAAISLAKQLLAFDADLAITKNLRASSLAMLARYGVNGRLSDSSGGPADIAARRAALPERGPLIVVSNHPGLFDAIALFAAIGREDLAVIAAERDMLAALPNLRPYLLTAKADARGGFSLRAALRHLQKGGALLHFAAGRIEPDPRLLPPSADFLLPWKAGLETLIRLVLRTRKDLVVVPALVSGVVSPRARKVALLLGRGGALTDAFVPLLQLTLPFFHDVDVRVSFADEKITKITKNLGEEPERFCRDALARLAQNIARNAD